jgi:hypothetical protein
MRVLGLERGGFGLFSHVGIITDNQYAYEETKHCRHDP